jgi:hypothetical protein
MRGFRGEEGIVAYCEFERLEERSLLGGVGGGAREVDPGSGRGTCCCANDIEGFRARAPIEPD